MFQLRNCDMVDGHQLPDRDGTRPQLIEHLNVADAKTEDVPNPGNQNDHLDSATT